MRLQFLEAIELIATEPKNKPNDIYQISIYDPSNVCGATHPILKAKNNPKNNNKDKIILNESALTVFLVLPWSFTK